MKIRMIVASSVVALSVAPAVASELPQWQPRTICSEDSAPDYCRFLETQARRDIAQQWAFIPSLVREQCVQSLAAQRVESWRFLGDCLADAASGGVKVVQVETGTQTDESPKPAMEAALAEAQARIDALEAETGAAQARIAELEAALAEAPSAGDAGALEEAQSRAAAKAAEVDGLNALLVAFRKRQSELDAELSELRGNALASAGAADRVDELEAELETAQLAARQGTVRIEGLQTRLAEMMSAPASESASTEELDAARAALSESEARIAALEAELEASAAQSGDEGAVAAELDQARTALARSETRISGLQDRLRQVLDDRGALEKRVAELESAAGQAMQLEGARDRMQAELRSSKLRVDALQQRLREALAEVEGAQAGAAQAQRMQGLLENFRERGARVGQTVAAQRARIGELEMELKSVRGELAALSAQAQTADAAEQCQAQMSAIASDGAIQFEISSADLKSEALPVLDSLIEVARSCPSATIVVEGHTDSYGDPVFNEQLSQRRADSVAAYMTERGVAPARVSAVGRGFSDPVASNETRAGRAQNRRIEFVVN